jgi:hypothetical protein
MSSPGVPVVVGIGAAVVGDVVTMACGPTGVVRAGTERLTSALRGGRHPSAAIPPPPIV